jgi:hypothetical protein
MSEPQFAYQAVAGINYELSPQSTLGLEFISERDPPPFTKMELVLP